jgi:quinol monooxygenase YgiN
MHRLTITRLAVEDANVPEWEEAIVKQIAICSEEPGTMLYGFARRGKDGSTLLPQPRQGITEYIQVMAYESPDAFDAHLKREDDWWRPTAQRLAPMAMRAGERIDDASWMAVVSRDHQWRAETMLNLGLLRFKVPKDGAENFERDARRQIDMVTENELGTVLYGFIRRSHAPSGLLPKPIEANVEYLSLSAYVDADARKLHGEIEHRGEKELAGSYFTFEGDWAWGTAYRSHLASPLENEAFPNTQIVAAMSRYSEWKS